MDGENWVVKSNALIEAKGKMTALEHKFILNLISEITPEDKDFKEYYLSVNELKEKFNITDKNIYEVLKDVANKLMDRKIEIEEITDKGKRSFLITRYLSSARYIEGEGKIKVSFDPELKPYLLEIKERFTQYQLKNVLSLKGSHSIRIYELLKQYEKIKKRTFDLIKLKELLGVADGYDRFYDFEKYVLEPAKAEINAKTDIIITYEKIKVGRKISEISFKIKPKFIDEESEVIKIYKESKIFDFEGVKKKSGLLNYTFSDKQILEIYEIAVAKTDGTNISPYDYINRNREYCEVRGKDTIFNYLKGSLQSDYAKGLWQLTIEDVI